MRIVLMMQSKQAVLRASSAEICSNATIADARRARQISDAKNACRIIILRRCCPRDTVGGKLENALPAGVRGAPLAPRPGAKRARLPCAARPSCARWDRAASCAAGWISASPRPIRHRKYRQALFPASCESAGGGGRARSLGGGGG